MKRRAPLRRSGGLARTGRLSPVSARRRRDLEEYAPKRRAFLAAHPICQVWLARRGWAELEGGTFAHPSWGYATAADLERVHRAARSVDIHHKAGRTGGAYLDVRTWMAVSRHAHDWIHANPRQARAAGWLV